MRQSRKSKQPRSAMIGYRADDLQQRIDAIQSEIRLKEIAIYQEEEAFNSLYEKKLVFHTRLSDQLFELTEEEQRLTGRVEQS